jgi:phenylpropionate dioxygenase-like ring-hydroxylating dioxygenase large terminal subunit
MYEQAWIAAMRPWWHVVARSEDVAPGGVAPVELLGERLALWRSADGALSLVDDQCPHRGVALSLGHVTDDGCLRCPYHGWTFAADGACTRIPQLGERILPGAEVRSVRVEERYGFVWACLVGEDEERGGIPGYAELDAGTHWFWMGWSFDWDAQNLRQIENFCDVAHFAVLHADTFGHESGIPLEPGRITADDRRLSFRFDTPVCDPGVPPYPGRPTFPGYFDYAVTLPCTVHLGGASGPDSVMFLHSTPLEVFRTRVFWGCAFPHGTEIDDASYAAIERAIWTPDMAMVSSQRPKGLPLEATAELHLPHDRFAVAFRRALAELGVPSGSVA